METRAIAYEPIGQGIVALQIATDADPYLGPSIVPALRGVVDRLATDQSVHVVILQGGTQYFSAGGSRAGLLSDEPMATFMRYIADIPRLLLSVPVPTIAAMAGHAVGGGLLLGLWCDIPILAEESLYGANFMALGFTPGMGSTTRIAEMMGAPLAREMLYTGRLVKGRDLKGLAAPLAHAVVPRAQVYSEAITMAEEIASVPRDALVLLKRTLAAQDRNRLEAALEAEKPMHTLLFAREETRQQIKERYVTIDNDRAAGGRKNHAQT